MVPTQRQWLQSPPRQWLQRFPVDMLAPHGGRRSRFKIQLAPGQCHSNAVHGTFFFAFRYSFGRFWYSLLPFLVQFCSFSYIFAISGTFFCRLRIPSYLKGVDGLFPRQNLTDLSEKTVKSTSSLLILRRTATHSLIHPLTHSPTHPLAK